MQVWCLIAENERKQRKVCKQSAWQFARERGIFSPKICLRDRGHILSGSDYLSRNEAIDHRTTPKKRHFMSNNLSAYLWFKLIEAPSDVLAKESRIVLTFCQRCIYVISGISIQIFLWICLSFYFSWRNLDGADVPVSEILSDTFISSSADSLGIFFDPT